MPAAGGSNSLLARLAATTRDLVAGRRVILAGFPTAGAAPTVTMLRAAGAERCFVLGPMVGTGTLPDEADADCLSLDLEAPDPVAEFRLFELAMAAPPGDVVAALDHFDPSHEALVLHAPFHTVTSVAGRPVFGARRPEWVALEDKTTNDAFFDRAGVPRAASTVVDADDAGGLAAAAAQHDVGAGTVWSGDARDGFNGGGVLVRWVTDLATATDAQALFAGRCDRVRVAPFLDGVPCSIHGLATENGIAVFRPVEMVTLRTADPPAFRYGGAATFWDPPSEDRAAMRAVARQVGKRLRDEVGFRGSYGIDGVLTAEGFRPTELNPRFGAGLGAIAKALPELPLLVLHWVAAAGWALPATAAEIEETLVTAADARRAGGGWVIVDRRLTETRTWDLVVRDGRARRPSGDRDDDGDAGVDRGFGGDGDDDDGGGGEPPDGTLEAGPSSEGGFVRFTADPERTPTGPSIAPRVCAVLAWADAELDLGLGPLTPATSTDAATPTRPRPDFPAGSGRSSGQICGENRGRAGSAS